MLIATHDGTFHADETMACAILTYLFDNSSVIRSRDSETLETADIILDVSGINDERHFDHHSPEFTQTRESGVRYATAGLMWKKYGIDYLQKVIKTALPFHPDKTVIGKAHKRIDDEIMVMIDLNDNGQLSSYVKGMIKPQSDAEQRVMDELNDFYQADPTIPYIVAMANLPNQTGEAQEKSFMGTVKILKQILFNASVNALHTEAGIAKVLSAYQGDEILILHEHLPWTAAVLDNMDTFKNCLLAVYPDRNHRWRVQSLPVSRAKRFINRLSAPKAWRGLNCEELDKATGLTKTNFVHRSGFTGGAGEFETCLELAKMWLKNGVRPEDE